MANEFQLIKFPGAGKGDSTSGGDHTGGSDGGGSDLEARVAKLESHVEYMRRDISDLRTDVKAMSADLVSMKLSTASIDAKLGNVDKHMVTKGQLAIYALLTLLPIMGGGWWIVQQYLVPIFKALPK